MSLQQQNLVTKKVVKKITLNQTLKKFVLKEWGEKGKKNNSQQICKIKYEELLIKQQKLAKQHKDYVLGVDSFQYNTLEQELHITYNCSENAKSFFNLNFQSTEEKFNVFVQLVSLSQYLINNNILHNNIKSTNIIIDNNKLYLTDFGYYKSDGSDENPTLFKDCLNFLNSPSINQLNQHYAYLQIDQLEDLVKIPVEELLQRENFLKKSDDTVKMQDQYALTVMMLQIIYTFPKVNQIQDIIGSKYLYTIKQIKILKEQNEQVPEYALFIIVEILKDRFQNQYFNKYTKIAPILNYKVNQQNLINQENLQKVQQFLKDQVYTFDKILLYYFSNEELKNLFHKIRDNNQLKQLEEEIKRILGLSIVEYKNQLDQMSIEDKYIFLVHLDEKIQNFKIISNDINQQQQGSILIQFEQKLRLKSLYDEINQKFMKDFKFNNNYSENTIFIIQFNDSLDQFKQTEDNNIQKESIINSHQNVDLIEPISRIAFSSVNQSNQELLDYHISASLLQPENEDVQVQIQQIQVSHNDYALQRVQNKILREYFRQIINKEEFSLQKKYSHISQNDFEEQEEGKTINIIKQDQQNSKEIISIIQLENRKSDKKTENLIIYYFQNGEERIYKEYQALEFNRYRDPNLESMYEFNLNKQFITKKDGSGNFIDLKQNIKYTGGYKIQEQDKRNNFQFHGIGVRELLNQNTLRKGQIYKVDGFFIDNRPSGKMKTYFYGTNIYCQGEYKNGKLSGYQEHFIENNNKPIKKTYHLNICYNYVIELQIV